VHPRPQHPRVVHPAGHDEWETPERCHILESWNVPEDREVSIARARVEPGVRTQLHRLRRTVERYLVIVGTGRVELGGDGAWEVGPGDVVVIPAGVSQRIENTGDGDLLFYCICTPAFDQEDYEALE
jgi:mannose-6-phosphate isomerase-like protein (cupin superfamily)